MISTLIQQSTRRRLLSSSSSSSSFVWRRCLSTTGRTTSTATSSSTPEAPSSPLSLYTWGTNTKGCLLQDTTESIVWEPQLLDLSSQMDGNNVAKVVCGPTDTAIISDTGKVYVAGANKSGQLGLGHKEPVVQMTEIPNLPPVATMALGSTMGALVTQDGDLYSFGFGGSLVAGMGCLGHGDGESYLEPKLVESLVEDGCYARDVCVGESHMTVLTTEGEILTTGASSYGRLGNGETSVDQLYLEPVEILPKADQITGGKSFTLALSEGVIHGWGRNHKGQLGTGFGMAVDMYSMEEVPCPIDADELINRTVIKVAAGHSHAACVTSSGELFTWGSSLHLEPVRVMEVLHTKIVDVACGNDYTMALSEDAHIYVWGRGKTGVLGVGPATKNLNQAQMINTLIDQQVVAMSAGWAHAACLVK